MKFNVIFRTPLFLRDGERALILSRGYSRYILNPADTVFKLRWLECLAMVSANVYGMSTIVGYFYIYTKYMICKHFNDQTVLFQTIQSGPGSNGNERVLCIPQSSSITGALPSNGLIIFTNPSAWAGYDKVNF